MFRITGAYTRNICITNAYEQEKNTIKTTLDLFFSLITATFAKETRNQVQCSMNQILMEKKNALHDLCKTYKVKSMYAFGSVNTPAFSELSDIDLLIDFMPDLSAEEYTDAYFMLHAELSQLFNRKIDLITQRSLSNPYFIADIERNKLILYGKS